MRRTGRQPLCFYLQGDGARLDVEGDRTFGQNHVVLRAGEVVDPAGGRVSGLPQRQLRDHLPNIAADLCPEDRVVSAKLCGTSA